MSKSVLNIQDSFLNQARKDRIVLTMRLVDGGEIVGRIVAFDNFTVIMESEDGEQQKFVYKHSIAYMSAETRVRWNSSHGQNSRSE